MITQIKKDYIDCSYSISFILSIFSAVLLLFSFPPFNLSFLAWLALIPLFSIPKELSPKKTFIFYYSAGLIFWLCHIWWLNYVTSLGYVVLSAYLALFFGFFGLFLKLLREKTPYPLVFIAPPLWIIFELARTYLLISFPWSLLGYSQWQNIPLIQISSITGVYGVSFLIVMFNAAIADFIFANPNRNSPQLVEASNFLCGTKTKTHFRNLLLSLLILAGIITWGYMNLVDEGHKHQEIKISVIQGNIPQDIKWDEEYAENIVNIYAELSIYASTEDGISLIVWPETAYPDYVYIDSPLFKKVKNLIRYTDTPLLMGAVNWQNGRDYNSAFLILPDKRIEQTMNQNKFGSWQVYNKLHLVPFAEYIPFQKFFFFLSDIFPQIGDFSKGDEYTIFEISNSQFLIPNKFAVLICFEDLFPDLARNFTNKGANFLVVITNDAHFKESPALWQHFTHSVFRAVENRRPLVRAANNGISGFIDAYGRPIKILNKNGKAVGVSGFETGKIIPSSYETFYTRFGDLFVYANIFYLVIILIIVLKKDVRKL